MTDHGMPEKSRAKEHERVYLKNRSLSNFPGQRNIWVGDYASEQEFQRLAEKAHGIKRIGILRADVDNLGKAFVHGFSGEKDSILRTSSFSRKLSEFFKWHINDLLEKGTYHLGGTERTQARNATIVYSGGDDMFVVGAWDDILGFAIDLYHAFSKYTQDTLTLSAGIGLYAPTYPISAMARECGELEEFSKQNPGKNSCTLFAAGHTYTWDVLINKVLGEKYSLLRGFLQQEEDHGNAMLYKMLELIRDRNAKERLNIARFAYLLARLRPVEDAPIQKQEAYKKFSRKMYRWIQQKEDADQLITAIYLYVYYIRGEEAE